MKRFSMKMVHRRAEQVGFLAKPSYYLCDFNAGVRGSFAGLAKNSMIRDAKETVVDAAKTGAEEIKETAREALGAAAAAAAGVVLQRVSGALAAGEAKVTEATPAATEAARLVVSGRFNKPARKRTAKKGAHRPNARRPPRSGRGRRKKGQPSESRIK